MKPYNMRTWDKTTGLAAAAGPAMLLGQGLVWFLASEDAFLGISQKIFYSHVPLAWWALAAFTLNALAGIAFLRTRRAQWDRLAQAAAECGLAFAVLALASGMFWAKCAWGVWWTADPRLITFAALCLMYAGYVLLRHSTLPQGRRKFSQAAAAAVWGVIAGLNVPLLFLAAGLLRSAHPTVVGPGGGLEPGMLAALLACLAAFGLVWLCLLLLRLRLLETADELSNLESARV